jgi:hypothetical protein
LPAVDLSEYVPASQQAKEQQEDGLLSSLNQGAIGLPRIVVRVMACQTERARAGLEAERLALTSTHSLPQPTGSLDDA